MLKSFTNWLWPSRTWCLMDLVLGKDGKLEQTKLAATCFHASLFAAVVFITIKTGEFNEAMWLLYAGAAITHSVADKSAKQVIEFKNKKLDMASAPAEEPKP